MAVAMSQILFKNRWFAAIFAGITLVSVALFVDKDGQGRALVDMADDLRTQREALEKPTEPVPVIESSPQPEAAPVQFVPDEELVEESGDGNGDDGVVSDGESEDTSGEDGAVVTFGDQIE